MFNSKKILDLKPTARQRVNLDLQRDQVYPTAKSALLGIASFLANPNMKILPTTARAFGLPINTTYAQFADNFAYWIESRWTGAEIISAAIDNVAARTPIPESSAKFLN